MATKRENLLKIKADIEAQLEHLTITQATFSSVLDIFSNCLIMNKQGETNQKDVKDFYSKYDFIKVKEQGIGWTIEYNPIKAVYIVQGNYGYGWDDLTEEETRKKALEQKRCYDANERYAHRIITRYLRG